MEEMLARIAEENSVGNKKEMLTAYKTALSAIAKIKLNKISIEIQADFDKDSLDFSITVFDKCRHNTTLSFYDFMSAEQISGNIKIMISAIRSDDFETCKLLVKNLGN